MFMVPELKASALETLPHLSSVELLFDFFEHTKGLFSFFFFPRKWFNLLFSITNVRRVTTSKVVPQFLPQAHLNRQL